MRGEVSRDKGLDFLKCIEISNVHKMTFKYKRESVVTGS